MLGSLWSRFTTRGKRRRLSKAPRASIRLEELEPRCLMATISAPAQADTWVERADPAETHGTSTGLRADLGPEREAFLRFKVSGVSGAVQSAKLRVYVYGATDDGPAVY